MFNPTAEVMKSVSTVRLDWKTTLVALLFIIPLLTRLITSIRYTLALRQKGEGKKPPLVPYWFPFLAHTLSFGLDPLGFSTRLKRSYGSRSPIRIHVANQNLSLLFGGEKVLAFFKASREATTIPGVIRVLESAFGEPRNLRYLWERDTTGLYHTPLEGSKHMEPHNRIVHQIHKVHHTNMSGTSLANLGSDFAKYLEKELNFLEIGDEWTDIEDFYALVQKTAFRGSITAIFGSHLIRLNPTLVEDFWKFDSSVPSLFKDLPRWLVPEAYRSRDKVLKGIKKWYAYAEEHFDWNDENIMNLEWEEYYGSKLTRERLKMYNAVDGMTEDWRSASDLGLIFGAASNLIPLIAWEILDTISRPEVLARCRDEISKTIDPSHSGPLGIQLTKLFNSPLLLSVYSEEMRLRFGAWIQRTPATDTYQLNGWKFAKGDTVICSPWHEHRDTTVWNEGPVKGVFHSIEDFWAERFLVYPNDPATGPRKSGTGRARKPARLETEEKSNEPKFVADTVAGSFFPYGGGSNICPGRFFAKQEAVIGLAQFITMFDIELVGSTVLKPNVNFFPFGILPPVGKIPARMRRRKQS